MDERARRRLAEVMAAIAGGDAGAVFRLYAEFGGQVGGVLRRELRRLGVHHVTADELDGMVIDACLVLLHCAAAWDPAGGATPWVWARHRLRRVASAWVGQHAGGLDVERLEAGALGGTGTGTGAGSGTTPTGAGNIAGTIAGAGTSTRAEPHATDQAELDVLRRLAPTHRRCALVLEALERVASERDQAIVLEVRGQALAGDPSPALTVARRHGLSGDAVRQVVRRVRSRLARLAATDPRFSPLADLPLVA